MLVLPALSSNYPLVLEDVLEHRSFRFWPWADNLKVEERNSKRKFVASNCPKSFFDARGDLHIAVRNLLPGLFHEWGQQIPQDFRCAVGRLAGSNPRLPQLLILRLMKQDQTFRNWIFNLVSSEDGAYLRIVWDLSTMTQAELREQEQWFLNLPGQKRHEFLSDLTGLSISASQAKKTRKLMLDSAPWSRLKIHDFFHGLHNPEFVRTLDQAEVIRLGAIHHLQNLPKWLWYGRLWQVLSWFNDRALASVLPPMILEATDHQQRIIRRLLKKITSPAELEATILKLVNQLGVMVPFPDPPFLGNELLKPINSAKKLQAEGNKMQHCVAGYINLVARGESFFYHWKGDERLPQEVTVEVRPYRKSTHWQVHEALGYKNLALTENDWIYLRQQVAECCSPWGHILLSAPLSLDMSKFAEIWSKLKRHTKLRLITEDLAFDTTTVRVESLQGQTLGFLPKAIAADLMPYFEKGIALNCKLNYVRQDYATVSVYVAPAEEV